MDVLRTLLVFGLIFAIWELPAPGLIQRPIRDFVHWGLKYPFLFLVMAAVALIVWGIIGRDYGLQILFLHDDTLIQFELGIATSLLVLGINFHYFVLDTSGSGWRQSLDLTIRVCRGFAMVLPSDRPIHTVLHNGFLEYLWPDDLGRIEKALHLARHRDATEEGGLPWWRRTIDAVRLPKFRVLFAPAVLMVNSIPVVLLLGLFTSIGDLRGRWPWLLGVATGAIGAVVLACYTSRWLAVAKGWGGEAIELRQLLETAEDLDVHPADGRSAGPAESRNSTIEHRASSYVIAFFAVHLAVFGIWRTDPPKPDGPNWPWSLAILVYEAAAATVMVLAWRLKLARAIALGLRRFRRGVRGGLESMPWMTARASLWWWAGLGMLAVAGCLALGRQRAGGSDIRPALGALALMTVFLLNWLICFYLAASYDLRPSASGRISPFVVCGAAATGILGILLCSCEMYRPAGICGGPAFLIGAFGFSGRAREVPTERHRLARAAWLVVGLVVFVSVLWSQACLPASIWLMFGIMSVSAFALSALARSDRPAMIYPASATSAYISFAVLYNGLPESSQAFLPAGASVIVLLGLTASVYMVIKFSHPRYAALGCLVVLVGLFAINGNAWQVDPNHFKLQFPHLEAYYHNRPALDDPGGGRGDASPDILPTFLDTRAYVRSTVSSIVKLRHADLVQEQNLQFNQSENEKLSSVGYETCFRKDRNEVFLGIKDTRGRFRAAPWDSVWLILPNLSFEVTDYSRAGPTDDRVRPTWTLRLPEDSHDQGYRNEPESKDALLKESFRMGAGIRVWFNPADGRGVGLFHFDTSGQGKPVRGRYKFIEGGPSIALELNGMEERAIPPRVSVGPIFKGRVVPIAPGEKFDLLVMLENSSGLKTIIESYPQPSGGPAHAAGKAEDEITIGKGVFQRMIEESHLVLGRQESWLDTSRPVGEPALRAAVEKLKAGPGDSIEVEDRLMGWPVVLGTYFDPTLKAPGIPPSASRLVLDAKVLENLIRPAGMTTHRGWDLELMRFPADSSGIPRSGRNRIIVAIAEGMLHFRIFDGDGKLVADKNERMLTTQARQVEDLKGQLEGSWPPNPLTSEKRDQIIAAVMSIVGHRYFLRVAHDRGMFRATAPGGPSATTSEGTPTASATLSRGDRVRKDDRLIMRWCDFRTGAEQSRVVQVMSDGSHPDQGSSTFQLAPWPRDEGSGALWPDGPVAGTWQIARPLDNLEVLHEWQRRVGSSPIPGPDGHDRRSKPPLVIITVSGGGIRSSVWTETVLKTLEESLGAKFPYHIRLITGASGGMVAAAHFAASLPEPPAPGEWPGHHKAQLDAGSHLADDQLSAVAGCLVFNDIPGMLNPVRRRVDRGRMMEETWSRLTAADGKSAFDQPLRGLIADELAGWRPSLVFTPMLVEDGRRLLISNLDLSFVARNYGRILLEQDSRNLDPSYGSAFGPYFVNDDDILSLSAVEFYRLFPKAWDFRVSTAVRMSASFPWISPAVSLPTLPPRRVVDAGYYDNYGINLASQWLIKQRNWLRENTSGVVVIQIRDGASQAARTSIDFDRRTESHGAGALGVLDRITWGAPDGILVPGLYPVNTPLEGISSARQWSMSFRNDEQVEIFDTLLRTAGESNQDPSFFRTVVFECPVPASLSWSLSNIEREWIQAGLPSPSKDVEDLREVRKVEDLREVRKMELEHLDNQRGRGEISESEYLARQEKLYLRAFEDLKYRNLDRFSIKEIKDIYANLMNNRQRLNYLKLWWDDRMDQTSKKHEGKPAADRG